MPARKSSKVKMRWYRVERKEFGPVVLDVLLPAKEYETVEVGDPIEIILEHLEKGSKNKEGDFFEVSVEAPGIIEIVGENPRYKSQRMLFMKPARLLRVGVLEKEDVEAGGEGEYIVVSKDKFKWYDAGSNYYVYEGTLQVAENVAAVLLETSEGPRLVIPSGRDRLVRDALSR
ncbi:MAG: hypothetical protein F7C33_04775 [Desulfurococcales archaeon]|nr:hypothetical protein [Desulfurococcales archaeon]